MISIQCTAREADRWFRHIEEYPLARKFRMCEEQKKEIAAQLRNGVSANEIQRRFRISRRLAVDIRDSKI